MGGRYGLGPQEYFLFLGVYWGFVNSGTQYAVIICTILSSLLIKRCYAHQPNGSDPELSIWPAHFPKVIMRDPPGRYISVAVETALHVVVVLELLNFFMYAYFISCCYPLSLKSIQGSWQRSKPNPYLWSWLTPFVSLGLHVLLVCEMELNFLWRVSGCLLCLQSGCAPSHLARGYSLCCMSLWM